MALLPVSWNVVAHEIQLLKPKRHEIKILPSACQLKWRALACQMTHQKTLRRMLRSESDALLKRIELEKNNLIQCQGHIEEKGAELDMTRLDWKTITEDIFQDRFTPEHVQFNYSIVIRQSPRWTSSQLKKLPHLVAAHAFETEGLNHESWEHIASELNNQHSPDDCKSRWEALCLTNVRKNILSKNGNYWSEDEIRAYWRAWKQYGADWDRIAEAVRSSSLSLTGSSLLPGKTAKDCKEDYKHVITVSIPIMEKLEQDVGRMALNLSRQPRKHWTWTTDQLSTMEIAVREIVGHYQSLDEAARNMSSRDWKKVARKVDPNLRVTWSQCRYRWKRGGKHSTSLLKSNLKESDLSIHNTSVDKGRQKLDQEWTPREVEILQMAVEPIQTLQRIPKKFSRHVQQKYGFTKTLAEIRIKANEILGRSNRHHGCLPNKAAFNILNISPATVASRSYPRDLPTGKQLGPKKLPLISGISGDGCDINCNQDIEDEDEGDDEDDPEHGWVHPTMFVVPGILLTERLKSMPNTTSPIPSTFPATATATAAINACTTTSSNPGTTRDSISTIPPTMINTKSSSIPVPRFVWREKDSAKLRGLVQKYGESPLAWKQISAELFIPIVKYQKLGKI
ncbi:hypothetical protein FBU30_011204 [Linnemannia zychae]|nr:hypothetical protein FBU30_011204 [Linnemannia zychae]